MNRLASESSPYLQQHARNPVDWFPWGEEALARARAEQKPVLVSIGYAACHWCHVMERESFENAAVAGVMNSELVCIKVDREERPDVDGIYMDAVQAMGVRGGWPLNVFLTPDGRPFYGLTYAPPQQWVNLVRSVGKAWRESRAELETSADQFTGALQADVLRKHGVIETTESKELEASALDAAFYTFQEQFDRARGGLNHEPKFPMPAHYAWLVRLYARTGSALALDHTVHSLREMARGGLFDQVGGGWARYSVDGEWLVPHFEKMLYDNGQLLTACAEAYQLAPDEELKLAVEQTIGWVKREMVGLWHGDQHSSTAIPRELNDVVRPAEHGSAPQLAFASLDADSEGEEGRFYVWTWAELQAAFPDEEELAAVAAYYRATPDGNWEHGRNILHRRGGDAQFAAARGLAPAKLPKWAAHWREVLLAARAPRPRPGLDDKLLTGWNGLLLRGLCDAYRAFGDEATRALAISIGQGLTDSVQQTATGAQLWRNLKTGGTPQPGFLEDYAAVAWGLVALYEITFDARWMRTAEALLDAALAHFTDEADPDGLLFYTDARTLQPLIARQKELTDNVIPASNSLLGRALRHVGLLLGRAEYGTRARALLARVRPLVEREPGFMANWAALYEALLTDEPEIVIVGPKAEAYRAAMQRQFLPGAVMLGAPAPTDALPLLAGRPMGPKGETAIYVCFRGACQRPVYEVEAALAVVQARHL